MMHKYMSAPNVLFMSTDTGYAPENTMEIGSHICDIID